MISILKTAIEQNRTISFTYSNPNTGVQTVRIVEPRSLAKSFDRYQHLLKTTSKFGQRSYIVESISNLEVLDQTFEHTNDYVSLKNYFLIKK